MSKPGYLRIFYNFSFHDFFFSRRDCLFSPYLSFWNCKWNSSEAALSIYTDSQVFFKNNSKVCYRLFDIGVITCDFLGPKVMLSTNFVCLSPDGNWYHGNSPFLSKKKKKSQQKRDSALIPISSPLHCEFGVLNETRRMKRNARFYIGTTLCGYCSTNKTITCPPSPDTREASFVCLPKIRQRPAVESRVFENIAGIEGVNLVVRRVDRLKIFQKTLVLSIDCTDSLPTTCEPTLSYVNG